MTAALSVAGAPPASRRDVTIALSIGVVALLIAGLQPVILGGLESEGRLTASQIGLAATVELLALGLTCGLAAAFLKPDRVRLKLALACVAHAGAMFGTCLVSGVAVIAMRGAAGVFAGLMLWAAISTITRAQRPEHLSGVFVTVQTLAQLVLAAVLPATVVPWFGINGALEALGVISLLTAIAALAGANSYSPLPKAEQGGGGIGLRSQIGENLDPGAVGHAAIGMGLRPVAAALLARGSNPFADLRQCVHARIGIDPRPVCVENDRPPIGDGQHIPPGGDQHRDPGRRGEDRDMGSGTAGRRADSGQTVPIERQELRGEQILGDQYALSGQRRHRAGLGAEQGGDQLSLDIDQVGDTFHQQQIAGRTDRLGRLRGRMAPGKGCAAPGIDLVPGSLGQFRVGQQRAMRRRNLGGQTMAGRQFGIDRCHGSRERGMFGRAALPVAWYVDVGDAQLHHLPDRQPWRGRHRAMLRHDRCGRGMIGLRLLTQPRFDQRHQRLDRRAGIVAFAPDDDLIAAAHAQA